MSLVSINDSIDTGDTIKHKETNSVWTVACVIDGKIYRTGAQIVWTTPDGQILINRGSTKYKMSILEHLSRMSGEDPRKEYAIRKLNELKNSPLATGYFTSPSKRMDNHIFEKIPMDVKYRSYLEERKRSLERNISRDTKSLDNVKMKLAKMESPDA